MEMILYNPFALVQMLPSFPLPPSQIFILQCVNLALTLIHLMMTVCMRRKKVRFVSKLVPEPLATEPEAAETEPAEPEAAETPKDEVRDKILGILQTVTEPITTTQLLRLLSTPEEPLTRSEINRAIYRLRAQKLARITDYRGKAPRWALVE